QIIGVAAPVARAAYHESVHRPRHADVAQPALFFEFFWIHQRARVRKKPLFHSNQKDQWELEPFRRMQRHQRDSRVDVVLIRVTHQRRVVEKFVETLATVARIARSIYQFLEVLNPGEGLRCGFVFKLLHVPAAIDKKLDDLWNRGWTAR